MKKYLDLDSFITSLNNLKLEEKLKIHVKNEENATFNTFIFYKTKFEGDEIILHQTVFGITGIIQDDYLGAITKEDYMEGVWGDLTEDDGCKVYIEI